MAEALRLFQFVWSHPANRQRRLRALAKAIGWQLLKRTTGTYVDLALPNDLKLRCYPDSTSAALMLYCAGQPDYHEMRFMRDYLRAGDGFVDVGANVGVYTIYAVSCVGRHGHIDSLEPGPQALARLKENVRLNRLTNVRIHPVAAGAEDGRACFGTGNDTLNRLETALNDVGVTRIEVQCVRLDSLLVGGRYAMGKMDIEGAEPLALGGATRMLEERNPPVWLLEMNGSLRHYSFTEEGLRDWLAARGYDLGVYDSDSRHLEFLETPWAKRVNVLAIARDRRELVLGRIAESRNAEPTCAMPKAWS
jgi:FkbM family methyltransferase